MKLIHLAKSFWTEEDGVTAIEYGLIAALVAVAIVVGAGILGTSLDGLFTRLGNCMATPTAAVCGLVV
jgi:pilus assembly protein Flp/PilA